MHAEEGLAAAQRATEIFFGAEIGRLSDSQLLGIFADVPSQKFPSEWLDDENFTLLSALVRSHVVKSSNEARRLISQGGVYVNNVRMQAPEKKLTRDDLASETVLVLRTGKKNYALLRFVP